MTILLGCIADDFTGATVLLYLRQHARAQHRGFLITPTDACLGSLDPDRLARLDADGRQVAGDRASKTITLHRRIYEATAASGAACSAQRGNPTA